MSSEDSDDEPLSVLAAVKKAAPKMKKVKKKQPSKQKCLKRLAVTIKPAGPRLYPASMVPKPTDAWLYLKDFNLTGPFSCLLCSEWFISRTKVVIHYILNHGKDFCGICRYFVPDRDHWHMHVKSHSPWQCSQCPLKYEEEKDLRQHLSQEHKLLHCQLCFFQMPDDDSYGDHLQDKHNVTNIMAKDEEPLWQMNNDGSTMYLCFLCSKSNIPTNNFCNHYMSHHRITLKCFTGMLSGKEHLFRITGANITMDFVQEQLKESQSGYLDLDPKLIVESNKTCNESTSFLKALIPEIKQEIVSDHEDTDINKKPEDEDIYEEGPWKTYEGTTDFDVTATEVILLEKCYVKYVSEILEDVKLHTITENSYINYENNNLDAKIDETCLYCEHKCETGSEMSTHLYKAHGVKTAPLYYCRICAATFDSSSELTTHTAEELNDFMDLWLCQFCDNEFSNREETRKHLQYHWDNLEQSLENCFSPHLGFKCRYCPMLFWNEPGRETHHNIEHFREKTRENFYQCELCSSRFSDQVWFTHHYVTEHCQEEKIPLYLIKCCLCCLVLPNVEEMRTHFAKQHPEKRKYYCSLDSCRFKPLAKKKSFKLHLKMMHSKSKVPERLSVICGLCSREFSSQRAHSTHVAQVHGPGRFKCKICQLSMQTMDERKLHYLLQHPGRHPFECNVCGKSFPYKSSLYTHRTEHSTAKHPYVCPHCSKVFTKRDSYREHMLIHEGPRHACSYCPMRFVQRSNMLRHERRHTGERPYACPYCERCFSDKGACNSHLRTHTKDTSFVCMYCGQHFAQKSKLTYHIRKHTGENLETCKVCSKVFTSVCSLREHMKVHKRREPVSCPLCDRKYQDSRAMARHLAVGHSAAKFSCPLCDKTVTSKVSLRQHVVTHGRVKTFQCKMCSKSFAVKKSMLRHLRSRHSLNLKNSISQIRKHATVLDARDCEVDLDDETMLSIFGPPKKVFKGPVFVPTPNDNPETSTDYANGTDMAEEKTGDDSQDDESDDDDDESADDAPLTKIKSEPMSEGELEPTDFVSVKIEPIDEYEEQAN